jgi:hypothetical protein
MNDTAAPCWHWLFFFCLQWQRDFFLVNSVSHCCWPAAPSIGCTFCPPWPFWRHASINVLSHPEVSQPFNRHLPWSLNQHSHPTYPSSVGSPATCLCKSIHYLQVAFQLQCHVKSLPLCCCPSYRMINGVTLGHHSGTWHCKSMDAGLSWVVLWWCLVWQSSLMLLCQ